MLIFPIDVRGTQMHSSLSDDLGGVNASATMARLLARLDGERRRVLRFDAAPAAAPRADPERGAARDERRRLRRPLRPRRPSSRDVRALPGMTREDIEADLPAFLARAHEDDPELDATLVVDIWLAACEIEPPTTRWCRR